MRMSPTLSIYIARQFVLWFSGVFLALISIIFLLDTVELLRRASGKVDATIGLVVHLSLLKLPHMAMEMLPFVVLFSSMLTFWRMTRNHELTIVRGAGVSVWQFLLPVLLTAVLIGALRVSVLSPVAAAFYSGFEDLEGRMLRGRVSLLAVTANGFWLREVDVEGNAVIHAQRVSSDMELAEVTYFQFADQDRFAGRVDAKTATLVAGSWRFTDAWITGVDRPARFETSYTVPTAMTLERIQDSFASPETISFWDLPQAIRTLEDAGFSAMRHRLRWHSLIAGPLLLFAMVLIAATFSLRPARRGGVAILAVAGISSGFLLFFLSNLVGALGQTAVIPVTLAAWAPAAVSLLLGISTLLHLEDG